MVRMTVSHELRASLEDYLEAIYRISRQKHVARAKEIAGRLGVGNSLVTGALNAHCPSDLSEGLPVP